ncbi:MAG: hypothetical protein KKG09_03505 [Verrucomicrobia bacterium]|nr:hypothetical protein [Verrucomicrobiota bacterium]MCG2678544.1 hypothetical protein [Kiritimatiellia bacterium]MBU4247459.1 hypothetical protein [Verrucomicrobiota bacterium]MBU4292290.1 hypothetical protein [Verrucomicrobiota bacterium]MBU4429837.1 hypothetical protein [Verrucomicrobiota bacterium]
MSLRVATFQSDATPPLGTPLCFGGCKPALRIVDPLSVRGVVLLPENDAPVVLCAVDWVGIAGASHDRWREQLAGAAGTTADRVAVHCLHQHDTPGASQDAASLSAECGLTNGSLDPDLENRIIALAADTLRESLNHAIAITHLAVGMARVNRFASNRRILGPDGKVEYTRWSACVDEAVRARSEGIIDPFLRLISFWADTTPVASLTYYATHPQSFYRRGAVSADTVGLARSLREATVPEAAHIHFNGAGGNVTAGKYNDGSPQNRLRLARRLAQGMEEAWDTSIKIPVTSGMLEWRVKSVALPASPLIPDEETLLLRLKTPKADMDHMTRAISFLRRIKSGHKFDLTCLRLGPAFVLHMPGELFVEYQLAAQALRPNEMVCMAAYGDYCMGYIGTRAAYDQGGYETKPGTSKVGPDVEDVLMNAIRDLLKS